MSLELCAFIIIVSSIIIIPYFCSGMTSENGDYKYKGWIFGFARFLRKFLCGMFLGHKYENGKCVHCFKKQEYLGEE